MPMVIAGAAISGAFAAATALPWLAAGAFVTSFATSLVLGGLSYALSPKPKKPSFTAQVDSQTLAIRQPDASRKHVYGMTRISDIYAHMTNTGNNEKMHNFLVLCSDEIEDVIEVWADDYVIPMDWLDADGNVTQGRYANKLRIRKHLGSPTQVADPMAVAEIPEWTNNHRGQGVAYLYITMTKDRDVYPNGMPNFSAVIKGKKLLDPRAGTVGFTTNCSLFWYDYIRQAEYGFLATDANVNTDHLAAQSNICDEIVTVTPLDQVVTSINTTTDIFTMTGTYLLFEMGDRVEVVAPGGAPGGTSTSTAYYVIPFQTKDTPRLKLASSFANAMNSIAMDISTAGTGTITIRKTGEPRYHGAGILDTADALGDNINSMLNSMAGRAVNTAGAWKLLVGAWRSPTVEMKLNDIRGGLNFRRPVAMSEKFNVISGKYISLLNNYQPDDYPVTKYQTFIDQDGGVEYPPRDVSLPFTNRATTAQRIANIELFRSRQDIVFTASYSMKAFQFECGDVVMLTIPELGWEEKYFEITQVAFTTGDQANPALSMSLTLRETAEAIYDWESGQGLDIDPAPNTTLPNAFLVQVVTGLAFSSREIGTSGGDTLYQLSLDWDAHPNAYVQNNGFLERQFKRSDQDDSFWSPSYFVGGDQTHADVLTSSVNIAYDMRIRAVNSLGVRSNWATILNAIVGTSGGVGTTNNWGNWTDSIGATNDYGNWTDSIGATDDWEFFT